MSWTIFVAKFPPVQSLDELAKDFRPEPFGTRAAVIARLEAAFPAADFSDPSWGMLDDDGWGLEFTMGEEEGLCDSFSLRVHGGGPALVAVQRVLDAVSGRGLDLQTSEFFSLDTASDSFAKWLDFRDGAIAKTPS